MRTQRQSTGGAGWALADCSGWQAKGQELEAAERKSVHVCGGRRVCTLESLGTLHRWPTPFGAEVRQHIMEKSVEEETAQDGLQEAHGE